MELAHPLTAGTGDSRVVAVPVSDRNRDPWSVPPFKALFAPGGAIRFVINISVPFLDKMVARMPPVVNEATPYAAVYKFDWLSATGTAILFAALLSIVWLRMKRRTRSRPLAAH